LDFNPLLKEISVNYGNNNEQMEGNPETSSVFAYNALNHQIRMVVDENLSESYPQAIQLIYI
jgi:hypothetical protein